MHRTGPGTFNQPDRYYVLTEAKLAAFDNTAATYNFNYVDGDTTKTGLDATPISRRTAPNQDCTVPVQAHVPLLESVKQPDGLKFAMTYDLGTAGKWSSPDPVSPSIQTCGAETQSFSSNLTALTLPTGGSFAWEYRKWDFPVGYNGANCPGDTGVPGPCGKLDMDSVGVATRTALDANGAELSQRTYSSAAYTIPPIPKSDHTQITTVQEHAKSAENEWSVVSTTLSYFSIGTQQTADQTGVVPAEYGLPFTRFADSDPEVSRQVPYLDPKGPQTGTRRRFLTSKTLDASGVVKQYSYVAYEGDQIGPNPSTVAGPTSNRRVQGESTYYAGTNVAGAPPVGNVDATKNIYVYTERDDYDGVGHYRRTQSGSNIPSTPVKTSEVSYVGIAAVGGVTTADGRYDPAGTLPVWVTSPFTETKVWQGALGTPTVRAEYCFGTPDGAVARLTARHTSATMVADFQGRALGDT